MSYQPKVSTTQDYSDNQGEHIVHEGKLVLIETNEQIKQYDFCSHPNNGYTIIGTINHQSFAKLHGYKKVKAYIISETEKIEKGDKVLYANSIYDVIRIDEHNRPIVMSEGEESQLATWDKILALPEHFSNKHLQAIVDGKMKDGDKVLIKCKEYWEERNVGIPPKKHKIHFPDDYQTHLDQQNHITLFPATESIRDLYYDYFGTKVEHSTTTHDAHDVIEFAEYVKKNNY